MVRWAGVVLFILMSSSIVWSQDITSKDCMECHGDQELTKTVNDSVEISVFIDMSKFSNSVHGDLECIDCHVDIKDLPHDENLQRVKCSECHDDAAAEYANSVHGKLLAKGAAEAPQCWDCHGSHYVYPTDDSLSTLFVLNEPATCAKCHADPKINRKYHIPISTAVEAFETSIHFQKAKKEGNLNAATCHSCHGGHNILPSNDANSLTNKFNVPKTCSKCHDDIYQEYMGSVHGRAISFGATDAPVCTDCHSEHDIKAPSDPTSTVYSAVVSKTLCPRCHEGKRIATKYGIKKGVVQTYDDSYHGLMIRGGVLVAANCASCHGVHNIRSSDDPLSTINAANLAKTCGKCHPGASNKVTVGKVHYTPSRESSKAIYYVTILYYFLIFGTIGGMAAHNGLDFLKKLRAKFKNPPEKIAYDPTFRRQIERLTVNERVQHFALMASFITLAYTGFCMKFPEAWWARPLLDWEGGFAFRGFVHRLAAVVMLSLSFYHLYYIISTKRGRQQILAFLPTAKDAKDVVHMLKYYLGFANERPRFERYSYIEKAEYLALIWGTAVMAITGLIMWFENISLRFLPKWFIDMSLVIHYYEAILASLAILVWHFYFQFFDPHVYPMNTTCLTGKMDEDDYREEHPLDFDRAIKEGK
ncbi:MAG: hypothetical protein GXO74_15150 [Calditrichaeota bacterium]|nr:hypothetical protein [Calditrichota bacterium]